MLLTTPNWGTGMHSARRRRAARRAPATTPTVAAPQSLLLLRCCTPQLRHRPAPPPPQRPAPKKQTLFTASAHANPPCQQAYHTAHGGDLAERKARYTDMVNKYYDLATSFYEYGERERVVVDRG